MSRRSTDRGFSLYELIVVLAILAVLVALLMPVAMNAKANALVSSSISKMRQWSTAQALYREAYDANLSKTGDATALEELQTLGFGDLSQIGQHMKFDRAMYETGGSPVPGIGVPRYMCYIVRSEELADQFVQRFREASDSLVWLVDVTHNPVSEIDRSSSLRLVLGARLDTSVARKRVRGDLTRPTIWEN